MSDGLALVYSFYDPAMPRRSLGSFVILDHVIQACLTDLPYVYLGYWVRGSEKMDYKVRFSPIELLKPEGWTLAGGRAGKAEISNLHSPLCEARSARDIRVGRHLSIASA